MIEKGVTCAFPTNKFTITGISYIDRIADTPEGTYKECRELLDGNNSLYRTYEGFVYSMVKETVYSCRCTNLTDGFENRIYKFPKGFVDMFFGDLTLGKGDSITFKYKLHQIEVNAIFTDFLLVTGPDFKRYFLTGFKIHDFTDVHTPRDKRNLDMDD